MKGMAMARRGAAALARGRSWFPSLARLGIAEEAVAHRIPGISVRPTCDGGSPAHVCAAPHTGCPSMSAFAPRQRPGRGLWNGLPSSPPAAPSAAKAAPGRRASSGVGEGVGGGRVFVPSFYLVTADQDPAKAKRPTPASPSDIDRSKKTCFVLHGIFGGGKNWIPFVRTHLATVLPDWQFVLVDLRGHGDSVAAAGPNTLAQCADDVNSLAEALGKQPDVIVGHSLGGKIAIEYLRQHGGGGAEIVFVLDSWAERLNLADYQDDAAFDSGGGFMRDLMPGASFMVLRHLEAISVPVRNRSVVSKLLEEQGHCRQTTTWMVSNLRRAPAGEGLDWTFDLRVMRDLIHDAAEVDSLAVLRGVQSRVVFVRAGKGMRWSSDALVRLEQGVLENPLVSAEVIQSAAHWVHVDSPEELTRLMIPGFPGGKQQQH